MPNIANKVNNGVGAIGELSDVEFNPFKNSLQNVITDAGGSLVLNDEVQFRSAITSYASISNYYIDTGIANAYVLNSVGSFRTPIDGTGNWNGMLIRFRPTNNNTGASTINLAGLNGGTPINAVNEDGTVFVGGELSTTRDAFFTYNATTNNFRLINSALQKRITSLENLVVPATTITRGLVFIPKQIQLTYVSPTSLSYSSGNFAFDDGSGTASITSGTINFVGLGANTTYHIFAIYNPTTLASQMHYDISLASPTLPSGFTKKKYIFSFITNASSQLRPMTIDADGLVTYENAGIKDLADQNIASALIALSVPDSVRCEVRLGLFSSAQKAWFILDGNSSFVATQPPANISNGSNFEVDVGSLNFSGNTTVRTNLGRQIRITSYVTQGVETALLSIFTKSYKIII